jgi:hypothetical protein
MCFTNAFMISEDCPGFELFIGEPGYLPAMSIILDNESNYL